MPNRENDAPDKDVVASDDTDRELAEDSTVSAVARDPLDQPVSDTAGSDAIESDSIESDSTESQTGDDVTALRKRVEELEDENSELKNKYLRKQADFENYRKRMTREREEAVAYANQQLLLDLTSIIDDFERAIRSAEESRDYDAFHDGIVLIEKQFYGMLERKWGLSRFDSEGEPFDPQKHEAVTAEERADQDTQIVLEDYQKGYMLRDRVLRSAKVKVSMPSTEKTDEN